MQTVLVGNVEVDVHEEDGVVSAVFEGKDILEAIIELGFYDAFEEKVFKECNAMRDSSCEADYMAWAS